jgi:hypothetical protein
LQVPPVVAEAELQVRPLLQEVPVVSMLSEPQQGWPLPPHAWQFADVACVGQKVLGAVQMFDRSGQQGWPGPPQVLPLVPGVGVHTPLVQVPPFGTSIPQVTPLATQVEANPSWE